MHANEQTREKQLSAVDFVVVADSIVHNKQNNQRLMAVVVGIAHIVHNKKSNHIVEHLDRLEQS